VSGDGLLGPAEIRALADRLGITPTKALGQNFLHDPNTIRRIVRIADLGPADVALEVGPGLGSLTLGLLGAAGHVTAVEVDPVLAAALPATVADPQPTALVANLPYNVAVPVVLHLLQTLPTLRTGLVMVQAEVAERLAARPGSKAYGVPSVKAAWYADVRRAGSIPRAVFWPVPNVDSGLVALTRRDPPPGADRAATFAVVDAAFAQRRKTLRAALAGWAGSAAEADRRLRAAGVDPGLRGETLDVTAYARVAAVRPDPAAASARRGQA
jgi:16S rRNA (adenine1518-N6/adenine1519-N6)-dimethyltransferase